MFVKLTEILFTFESIRSKTLNVKIFQIFLVNLMSKHKKVPKPKTSSFWDEKLVQ